MIMLALLSIATVPLWLEVVGRVSGRPLNASPTAIAGIVMKMAVLPLVAGIALRAILPALAEKIARPIALVANVLLLIAILALLFATWRAVWEAVGDGAVAAMVVFVTAGLIVGHLLGGPDREHSAVLALSSASRHPAIALSIAAANFPDLYFVGTILLYLIVNALVGLPYLVWQRRRIAAALV
jgi:BASS family bile acid:Na+ symporter